MHTGKPEAAALRDWIREVAATLHRRDYALPAKRSRDFALLYGLCMQASRFASSYLALEAAGYTYEAAALARAAFEHAVTAHWAYFTKGGVDRFAVTVNKGFRSHNQAMVDFLDNDEFRDAVAARPQVDGKGMPSFTDRMHDLDSGRFLETTYRSLSLALHPTHAAVVGYLVETPEHTEVRSEPDPLRDSYAELHTAALSAMLARSLIEYIVDPEHARATVDEPSNRLQLPSFPHDELPDSKRRFKRKPSST